MQFELSFQGFTQCNEIFIELSHPLWEFWVEVSIKVVPHSCLDWTTTPVVGVYYSYIYMGEHNTNWSVGRHHLGLKLPFESEGADKKWQHELYPNQKAGWLTSSRQPCVSQLVPTPYGPYGLFQNWIISPQNLCFISQHLHIDIFWYVYTYIYMCVCVILVYLPVIIEIPDKSKIFHFTIHQLVQESSNFQFSERNPLNAWFKGSISSIPI